MRLECVKCQHVNEAATGSELEACPSCGALYAKAVPTRARPVLRSAPASGFGGVGAVSTSPPVAAPGVVAFARKAAGELLDPPHRGPHAGFVDRMRSESLYPTFRGAVQWVYAVTVSMAVVIGLVAAAGAVYAKSWPPAAGVLFALLLWLFARVCKEGSLMLADLCDASVRSAAAQDR